MKSIVLLALLSILNMLLFFEKTAGINVILFTILFILFIYYIFKNNDLIKNKKGLLFLIPIIILSFTYFIYDNEFKYFNLIAIPILYILMFIYTIKPTFNTKEIIDSFTKIIFNPLDRIPYFFSEIKEKSIESTKLSKENKNKIKSLLIVIPVVIIVLILLSTADQIFGNLFTSITNLFKDVNLTTLILRLIWIVVLFIYLGALFNYIINKYSKEKNEVEEIKIKINDYTIKLLLTILNVIYVVFDFIQIRSLVLKYGLNNINYAEYARSGFFQLVAISILNLVIVLMSKKTKETKYNKIMSIIMVGLTLIIIASSFMRMMMYESAYGYTLLRLLVYVCLITEVILLIPTVLYILDSKINIFKYYMIIIISVYTLINFVSVDYVIARNNINRYYNSKKLDLEYLMNDYTDNVPLLIELKNKTNDLKLKNDINEYLKQIKDDNKSNDFREFNISRKNAINNLKNS